MIHERITGKGARQVSAIRRNAGRRIDVAAWA